MRRRLQSHTRGYKIAPIVLETKRFILQRKLHACTHPFIIHLFIKSCCCNYIVHKNIYINLFLFLNKIHWPLNIYGQTFFLHFFFFLADPRIFIIHIDWFLALLANFHNEYGKNNYFWLAMKQIVAFNATRQNKKKD